LTELVGKGGQQPTFGTAPAPGGQRGVVIQPTTASIPPIECQFLNPGRYVERHAIRLRHDPSDPNYKPGGYAPVWDVTPDGSKALRAAEQEHCDDNKYAFYFSLFRFAEVVNELASHGTVYPNEAAARRALDAQVKIDPQNVVAYFNCLGQWTKEKRDTKEKWHTPQLRVTSLEYDSTIRDNVAVKKLTPASLSNLGHPSAQLVLEAAQACIGLTSLKP
jgi:hypothetical protein